MKKISWFIALGIMFISGGCFDTVEETTINNDGSGILVSSVDMGKLFSALSAMGGDEKMKEIQKFQFDTTILLKDIKDSLGKLTENEKKILEKGNVHLVMNFDKEKFSIAFTVPFAKTSEITAINDVLGKSSGKIMQNTMGRIMPEEEKAKMKDNDNNTQSMDNKMGTPNIYSYFDISYEKSKMSKKINKEKYAKVEDDESLKSLKEMGQMGMPMNFKTVFNFPKPAKKATGKGVTLSNDKKTVIIEGTLEDFFEDPSKFEYEIEY